MKHSQAAATLILPNSGSMAAISNQIVPCVSPTNTKGSSNLLPLLYKALPIVAKKKKKIFNISMQFRFPVHAKTIRAGRISQAAALQQSH